MFPTVTHPFFILRSFLPPAGEPRNPHGHRAFRRAVICDACGTWTIILSQAPDDNRVSAECCLRLTEKEVLFYIWDDGEIFDITDADSTITGFRAYFVAAIMERHKSKSHLTATSFNRNRFIFALRD